MSAETLRVANGRRADATSPFADLDEIAERYAPQLNAGQEQARRAREHIITASLPFAGRLARRYRNSGEAAADLEQVARLGLVKAVNRYDPERGSFTAYAMTTILGELKRHLRDNSWGVHAPRRMQELVLEVARGEAALQHELGRKPTEVEVAARCGISVADVSAARVCASGYRPDSLNRPAGDGPAELGDLVGDLDRPLEQVADQVTVSCLITRLPARERTVLEMRFHGDRTQSDIAAELGVSQMQVSRILSRVLEWMRKGLLTDAVPPWTANAPDDGGTPFDVGTRLLPSGELVVEIAGEVDRDNAGRLREILLDVVRHRPGGRMRLDLSRVPLLDAAGVGVLVAVHEAARVREVTVTVAGLQPFVRKIVAATGLTALLAEADA